jgi:two-component system CheB/CheR fusion protein
VTVLGVAAVYFGAAKLGLSMAFVAEQVSPVWPPTGIALAALLVLGTHAWPGVMLGAFLANVTTSAPVATALGVATGNTLETLGAAMALRRLGLRPTLERLRDVLALVVTAIATPVASATIGIASLCLSGIQPWGAFGKLWWVWWLGDAMGGLVMAPLLLVWAHAARAPWPPWHVAEGAALLTTLAAVSLAVFAGGLGGVLAQYPLHYLIFPFVIWAAVRLGQPGVSAVTFVASALAIWSTVRGFGPFALDTANESLVMLQLFLAVVTLAGLFLGAAIAERDRAERRRAFEYARLEASEERLQLALTAGRMGVWDWNMTTSDVRWSQSVEALHGLQPGTFDGTFEAFRTLVHPDDWSVVEAAIDRAITQRTEYSAEFRQLRRDGSSRWFANVGHVLFEGGRPVRMLGVVIDVTERKRLEEELRLRARGLVAADRRKNEFLAMLAHELRNPLAPILNAAALLEARGSDAVSVEAARVLIQRQVRHMARLVDDLLDVARVTSGKIMLRREPTDLATVVADAVESCRPVFERHGHRVAVALPTEPVHADADGMRIAQVVANLLDNATKYTADGGSISVGLAREGDEAVLRVRDTGIGMSAEMIERAFELFAQGERPLDRPESGLGIGLTLVRSLVELHGGRVTAASAGAGRGTEILVRLPLLGAETGDGAPAPAPEPSSATARRVLVVDDNVDTAVSAAALLELQGHEVRVAHAGPEAIALAREFGPDVVLLDIGLPGMDGYAVARTLRTDPRLAGSRLIAVSGYGQESDRRRSREAGFDEHLVKPVEPDELAALIA